MQVEKPAREKYLLVAEVTEPEYFAKLMDEAGLKKVEKHSLTLEITHLYIGMKPVKPRPIQSRCALKQSPTQ